MFVCNYGSGKSWLPGTVTGHLDSVMFQVQLSDGRSKRCHQDQLRERLSTSTSMEEANQRDDHLFMDIDSPTVKTDSPTPTHSSDATGRDSLSITDSSGSESCLYPLRVRGPPDRYSPEPF